MTPPEEMEDLIRNARHKTSTATDERIMALAEAAMDTTEDSDAAPSGASGQIRRTLMRSNWTKLATAAAVLAALVLTMYALTGSVDATSITLAEVRQAMEDVDWMRIINTGDQGTQETWFSFASQVQIRTDSAGGVVYVDFASRRQRRWSPAEDCICESTVSERMDFAFGTSGPFELIDKSIELAHANDGSVAAKEVGTYQGREVEIWTASRPVINDPDATRTLTVYLDLDSKLPIGATCDRRQPDGAAWRESDIEFQYPETGPADVYEAGVPRSIPIKPSADS